MKYEFEEITESSPIRYFVNPTHKSKMDIGAFIDKLVDHFVETLASIFGEDFRDILRDVFGLYLVIEIFYYIDYFSGRVFSIDDKPSFFQSQDVHRLKRYGDERSPLFFNYGLNGQGVLKLDIAT